MFEAIVVAVIGGVALLFIELAVKGLKTETMVHRLAVRVRNFLRRHLRTSPRHAASSLHAESLNNLLLFIRDDQDQEGLHEGEYGRSGNIKLTKDVFAPGPTGTTPECPDTKPRLYFTGWPVFVYEKCRDRIPKIYRPDVDRQLDIVKKGLSRLVKNGWVRIFIPGTTKPSPFHGVDEPTLISYRHSIRAVQVFLALGVRRDIVRLTLGRMLDQDSGMQHQDGGWVQCNAVFLDNDLWGAAYAIGFLHRCIKDYNHIELGPTEVMRIKSSLMKTIEWLKIEWNKPSGWAYGKLTAEENAIPLFHEIASSLLQYDRDFAVRVDTFKGYINPVGHPCESAIHAQHYAKPPELASRLAYAFYQTREVDADASKYWNSSLEYALSHLSEGMNSADAAMLVEMVLAEPPEPTKERLQ